MLHATRGGASRRRRCRRRSPMTCSTRATRPSSGCSTRRCEDRQARSDVRAAPRRSPCCDRARTADRADARRRRLTVRRPSSAPTPVAVARLDCVAALGRRRHRAIAPASAERLARPCVTPTSPTSARPTRRRGVRATRRTPPRASRSASTASTNAAGDRPRRSWRRSREPGQRGDAAGGWTEPARRRASSTIVERSCAAYEVAEPETLDAAQSAPASTRSTGGGRSTARSSEGAPSYCRSSGARRGARTGRLDVGSGHAAERVRPRQGRAVPQPAVHRAPPRPSATPPAAAFRLARNCAASAPSSARWSQRQAEDRTSGGSRSRRCRRRR